MPKKTALPPNTVEITLRVGTISMSTIIKAGPLFTEVAHAFITGAAAALKVPGKVRS